MLLTTREWLALTRDVNAFWEQHHRDFYEEYKGHYPNSVRPGIKCQDGFQVSIQAGDGLYCEPRVNLEDGNYDSVELGCPNQIEPLILEYAENPEHPTDTVYAQVPIQVVDELIAKHGGIVNVIEVNRYLRRIKDENSR